MVEGNVATMGAIKVTASGEYEYGQMPLPEPAQGQVQIKVHSAVINPSDCIFLAGKWPVPNLQYPAIPGWEGSGTVVKAGPDTPEGEALIGKRVAFSHSPDFATGMVRGSWCEYKVSAAAQIMPLQENISFEAGASSFVNPLTALGMVDRIKELGSKCCIITAAAS